MHSSSRFPFSPIFPDFPPIFLPFLVLTNFICLPPGTQFGFLHCIKYLELSPDSSLINQQWVLFVGGRVLRIRKRQFSTAFPIPFGADFVQIGKASMHSRENSHCNWPSLYSALFYTN